MQLPLSNQEQLAADPELSSLEILCGSAEIARTALFAVYPELTACGDFLVEESDVAPRQCLAVAVISALDALIDSVEHYRGHLDNLALRRGTAIRNDDIF